MHRSVSKTQLAEQDLIDIWRYSYLNWGESQADHYLDELGQALELISTQPYLASLNTMFTPPVRIHHHAHHLIIYQAFEHCIKVLRVLHESMDVEQRLKS